MNIFRGDIHRLTRQSYAEDAADRETFQSGNGGRTVVPRCKPLRYAPFGELRVGYAIRRRLYCMHISKSFSIFRLSAHIANSDIVGTVLFFSLLLLTVRQFLAQAQLIRPEVVANVINSSGKRRVGE